MRSDIKVGIIGAMEGEVAHLVASLEGESVSTVAGMEFHAGAPAWARSTRACACRCLSTATA